VWITVLNATSKGNTLPMLVPTERQKSGVDEDVRKVLLKVLLEVYLNGWICLRIVEPLDWWLIHLFYHQ
jgi:hypothetical protein